MQKNSRHKIKFIRELEILKELKKAKTEKRLEGFPELYYYEAHTKFFFYVMDYLGQSLKDVKESIGMKLSLGTVLKIGLQTID